MYLPQAMVGAVAGLPAPPGMLAEPRLAGRLPQLPQHTHLDCMGRRKGVNVRQTGQRGAADGWLAAGAGGCTLGRQSRWAGLTHCGRHGGAWSGCSWAQGQG